jgi:hypothetical protein
MSEPSSASKRILMICAEYLKAIMQRSNQDMQKFKLESTLSQKHWLDSELTRTQILKDKLVRIKLIKVPLLRHNVISETSLTVWDPCTKDAKHF